MHLLRQIVAKKKQFVSGIDLVRKITKPNKGGTL